MRLRALVTCLVLVLPTLAHADLWKRVADGEAVGGSPAPALAQDDLLTWAGEAQPVTLPQLLQLAVRQAPALQNARIDIAVAQAQVEQTLARHDWTVRAQASGGKTHGSFSGITIDSTNAALGADLSRVLPTGGTIDLHAGTQYQKSASALGDRTLWSDDITGSITQPLLRGYGGDLYDASERRATLVRDGATLARRLVAIQTVQGVVAAYWDLVLAERQVDITRASLDLARERLRVTEIGAQGGKTAQAEIPAVQQIIATREEDVLNGELLVLDRSIALRRAVGMPVGAGELGLRVATELEARDEGWTLAPLVERAFQASPELAQLAKQDKTSTLDIEVSENGLLPQLDAALSLGPIGQEPKPSDAAQDLIEFKQLQINGSLTFSRSLHQLDVRGRVKELRAAREKLRVNAFDIRAQIAQSMARAVAQIELAKRRVVLSQRAIDLANQNIQIESERFRLGRSTNFDVLNRMEELRQAELRKAQALIDWHKAEAVVQALTGDLLPTFGIAVD